MLTAEQVSLLKRESGLDEDALAFALLPLAAGLRAYSTVQFQRWGYFSRHQRQLVLRWEHGVLWRDHAANCSCRAKRYQPRPGLRGEKGLAAITVNYTPCGHCRQFMNELNSGLDLRIHLPGRAPHVLRDYLPDAFGPKDLEIKTLLMDDQDHGFALRAMR